jgi:SNF2 family DNA or RNA helicase
MDHEAAILADDMGLGKTVQVLAAIRHLVGAGVLRNTVVLCPRSLLANWEAEATRWASDLAVLRVTPSTADKDEVWRAVMGRSHLYLTTYEQMRKPAATLLEGEIDLVVMDEAHRVRRLESQATRGVAKLQKRRIWALTGTPIERATEDFATLLSLLQPKRFSLRDAALDAASLRSRAKPFMLRRLKSDVQSELPDVIDTKEVLELTPQQQRSYTAAIRRTRETQTSDAAFLTLINELRAICDFDPDTHASSKVDRIEEIVDAVKIVDQKVVIFSYLLKPLDLLSERLATSHGPGAVRHLRGDLSLEERDRNIRQFRTDPEVVALLASSRVGGEGLTLTEANHVIFFNEWWNPSANAQARDRVVRIGQERGVSVHRFMCRGTVEELLNSILQQKSETVARVIDSMAESPSANSDFGPVLNELRRHVRSSLF